MWNSTDFDKIRKEVDNFVTKFVHDHNSESSVDEMWDEIKTKLQNIIREHVPSKFTTTRFNQPWITRKIKRMSKKEKKAIKIAKKSKTIRDWYKYKKLKKDLQKECRKAYEDYILNIVCGEYHQSTKNIFGFIKGNGCENS